MHVVGRHGVIKHFPGGFDNPSLSWKKLDRTGGRIRKGSTVLGLAASSVVFCRIIVRDPRILRRAGKERKQKKLSII
jgi:hypothetical protein